LRLLESTDLPMRRVAQLTGFRDEFYFSRVVRAATGKPPATYRRHAWAKA
jgi:transcriptional regulator GlxA family with amidase domain